MPTTIKLKNGSGAPLAGDLVQGEPAFDLTNKRLYTEDSGGNVIEVGTNPAAEIQANAGIALPDNQKATFGAGDDLQIYHDGTHSYISDQGTGNIVVKGNNFRVYNASEDKLMFAGNNGSDSYIYYDGSAKLRTTSTGIDVTGTVTADGLTVDGATRVNDSEFFIADNDTATTAKLSMDIDTTNGARIRTTVNGATTVQPLGIYTGSTLRQKYDTNGDISFYEDTGTTAKFFWDASAESLGIGTSSPSELLHVAGNIAVDNNGEISNTQGEGIVFSNSTDSLQFKTAATERMRIDISGNVGIGTSSPSATLHVKTVNGNGITLEGSTATDANGIYFNDTGGLAARIEYLHSTDTMRFYTAASEAMRIDSSGNLLVGKTSFDATTEGHALGNAEAAAFVRDGAVVSIMNRLTSDGDIASFRKDGTVVGSIGTEGGSVFLKGNSNGSIYINGNADVRPYNGTTLANYDAQISLGSSVARWKDLYLSGGVQLSAGALVNSTSGDGTLSIGGTRYYKWATTSFYPDTDNTNDLGLIVRRWDDVYATNGTIQTSDRNEKQDIAELSEAEHRVAVACKGLLRKFRWKNSVAEKGDDARIHFGIIAQDLQAAFEAEGLDAGNYAMFISTTWTDEETGEERTRLGVRYPQLLAFIIAAI